MLVSGRIFSKFDGRNWSRDKFRRRRVPDSLERESAVVRKQVSHDRSERGSKISGVEVAG